MAENWVSKFTTPYLHHMDISLSDFHLSYLIRYKLLKKMLIYIVLEPNPQKYPANIRQSMRQRMNMEQDTTNRALKAEREVIVK